jgi:putative endonuclease
MDWHPAVYILCNKPHGTLYIGVTSNLKARVWQHRSDPVEGFSRRYRVHTLVWYELHSTMLGAITREKQLKHWKRGWKIDLIEQKNPAWRDLFGEI